MAHSRKTSSLSSASPPRAPEAPSMITWSERGGVSPVYGVLISCRIVKCKIIRDEDIATDDSVGDADTRRDSGIGSSLITLLK